MSHTVGAKVVDWGGVRYFHHSFACFCVEQNGIRCWKADAKTNLMIFKLVMYRILILPDIRPAGYPAILKAGYWISGRISEGGRITNIRPDIRLFSLTIANHFLE